MMRDNVRSEKESFKNLPSHFRKSQPAIIQFSWTDAVTGLGYITFYGAGWRNASNTLATFLTTKATFEGGSGDATGNAGYLEEASGAGDDIELDFDITLQKPLKVAVGEAFFNCTVTVTHVDDDAKVTATLYHYDGSTETSLGTTTGQRLDADAGSDNFREGFPITISTSKQFATGDILRLTVLVENSGSTAKNYLYFDPASLTTLTGDQGRTIGTDLTLDVPFEVDI